MKKLFLLVPGIIIFSACTVDKDTKLSGAGATFPAPFYNIVLKEYAENTGNQVTYGATGSGSGIRSLKDHTIDFGATDVFLSDKELNEMKTEVLHIPAAMGAVVLAYNLENIKDLKLTADVISKIYRGKITHWNASEIVSINPGLQLPNLKITPVYRSDGSGTTYVFTDYMTKADDVWENEIGKGKSLEFPQGLAAKGNPGVAAMINKISGAIGYIGSEYALALNISSALLENKAGNFIKADVQSISKAAEVDIPEDTRIMITNSEAPDSYPISTFTWIIFYKEQAYNGRSQNKAKNLRSLLTYIISKEGQKTAAKIHFAPLSDKAFLKAQEVLDRMTYENLPIESLAP